MADTILYIILVFGFLIFFGLFLWLLVIAFKPKYKEKDNPILLNFCSSIDSGYFIGEVIKTNPAKNGRYNIEIDPKDVDPDSMDEISPINVIVDNGKLLNLPKGNPSKDRNILIALPPKAENMSGPMKETLWGKGIMFMTELDNLAKTQVEILREGITRRDALAKDIGTGEMTTKFMNFTNNLVQDYMTNILAKKDTKSSFGLPNPGQEHA